MADFFFDDVEKRSGKLAAFTLLEVLVVTAIMALLALVLTPAIRGALEHADYARCQARMRNLHQGCMNHLADHGSYPYAGSFEWFDILTGTYSERKGWVSWVHRSFSASDPYASLPDPYKKDPKQSHAKEFTHASCIGPVAKRGIEDGSLFKYVARDQSTYVCPRAQRANKKLVRSYAMNFWLGSRLMPRWYRINPAHLQTARREHSRMALFVEMETRCLKESDYTGDQRLGLPIAEDSAWDYYGGREKNDELYNTTLHRRAGVRYGHVIFLDGHIESLKEEESLAKIRETSEKIGNATY